MSGTFERTAYLLKILVDESSGKPPPQPARPALITR